MSSAETRLLPSLAVLWTRYNTQFVLPHNCTCQKRKNTPNNESLPRLPACLVHSVYQFRRKKRMEEEMERNHYILQHYKQCIKAGKTRDQAIDFLVQTNEENAQKRIESGQEVTSVTKKEAMVEYLTAAEVLESLQGPNLPKNHIELYMLSLLPPNKRQPVWDNVYKWSQQSVRPAGIWLAHFMSKELDGTVKDYKTIYLTRSAERWTENVDKNLYNRVRGARVSRE